jgi:hypothetical protein
VFAIALIVIFPSIATWFPEVLQAEARAVTTEQVDDSMNKLEEDPLKAAEEGAQAQEQETEPDALEKDDLGKKK